MAVATDGFALRGQRGALTPHSENPFGKHLTHSKNFFPRRSEKAEAGMGTDGGPTEWKRRKKYYISSRLLKPFLRARVQVKSCV